MVTTKKNGEVTHEFLTRTYIKNISENIEKLLDNIIKYYGSPLEGVYNTEVYTSDIIVMDEAS